MLNKVKDVLRPVVHKFREIRIKNDSSRAARHYEKLIDDFRSSGKKKINYASYVIYDSTYGMDGVFRKMMEDREHWDPKIVVIPDLSRGIDHAKKTYNRSKEFFVRFYGPDFVIDGWDPENNTFFDHLNEFDIVYYANPYDRFVHKYHKIAYASRRNVLPVYVSYGYDVGKLTTLDRLKGPELNLVWKLFADTTYTYQDYVDYQVVKGKNVVLAGYSKMDGLAKFHPSKNKRKKILITSHHTVSLNILPLSNFMEYYDLLTKLPDLFPELDFVFRPHPLLFTTLINNKVWTSEEVEKYISVLKEKGVEYSTGGDYLGIFAECDAIVNDCGSFTVEWLYTGKPGCFVYNKALKEEQLTTLMKKAINSYTIARSEEDIIKFIKEIADNEIKEDNRIQDWVKENIAINYPDVSSFILQEINILKRGELL